MDWTKRGREASFTPNKLERIGDSEENTQEDEEKEDEEEDEDDAESCIIGNSDDLDDDENHDCISWRMWCLLGQEGAWADEDRRRRSTDHDDVLRRSHLSPAINEAEKNRLFWEACLADESSMTPIF
ncbi:hypothetical protein M5K25_010630 [Dendrobium thyrsiflorum]|uniref:Uncharacterized protein n=1 Tax=Dendrobium thyrsiflorum TaxID=117978 RepID=A0ABD0V7E3_DENTH